MKNPLLILAAAFLSVSPAFAQKAPIKITVDLTEAPRRLYHAEIDLPVTPGKPAAFLTPQWIPGNHAPSGEANAISGVEFTANGKPLTWRRDDVNLYEFHLEIPAGVTTIHAHLDAIAADRNSRQMACLEWERLMLYPAHIPVKDIAIEPSITTPAGWGIGTALTPTETSAPPPTTGINESAHVPPAGAVTTHYAATNVEQLLDSPIITGKYFHEFPLAPEVTPKHYIDVVSDEPEDSNLRPELLASISNLVREAGTAYASHHYNAYHFLLTLSNVAGGEGLEHGQSSDNGVGEKGFADPVQFLGNSDLLSHEFTHSWDGKYRRPSTLYQPDFATPQQGMLLWVYEGMTQYMGNVLAARSGLKTQAQYRDMLAMSAASLDNESGRNWRSVEDTSIASSIDRRPIAPWGNWSRGQSYYQEGELVWLDADTLIREKTGDKKSLTDFQKIFLGKGGDTGPLIVPYDRKDLIHDLNEVLPYDWATFLHDRIDVPTPHTDLAGIERGGYKLVYTDKQSPSDRMLSGARGPRGGPNVWYSLGMRIGADGTIGEIKYDGVADKAGLTFGLKVIGVNGEVFSADALRQALDDSKGNTKPIHLLIQDENKLTDVNLDYHDGQRYPSLVRVEGTTDYLDEITKPLTK
jgi:predicted metalloprotease with PDZ domain